MTENFQVLSDREHVLKRSAMYIGSISEEDMEGIIEYKYQKKRIVPALIKCVEEIYQNSLDEHIRTDRKFANEIDVRIESDLNGTYISVSDNGRGIPVEKIGDHYRPELAWTALRAGSNFDDTKRVTAGTNGVGSALVNIFSTEFVGITCDGKNKITVTCSNNMETTTVKVVPGTRRGTSVTFYPDLEKFNLTEFSQDHVDVIRDRIANLAIQYPSVTFSLNGEKIKFKNIKAVGKLFSEHAVTYESEGISMVFAPSGSTEEFHCLSYVNGIYVKNGGSHVDYIMYHIVQSIREHVKKKHKIDVLPNAVKQHLLFASWVQGFKNLKFDSQTKERITNPSGEISGHMAEVDFDKLARKILDTPEIIDPMIQAILYRRELEERRELEKKKKLTSNKRVVNHIAASSRDPEEKMLFLAEGLSAIGQLLNVRNPKIHGGYPLRGKVMNVNGMRPLEIMKNKEISEMLSVIGLEIGEPANDLKYGKIVAMVDSDTDGAHIFCLLLNLFSLWPELFEQGRVYRLLTPLYVCTKGKDVRWFYTQEEYSEFDSTGYNVDYFKGLGTLTKEMYKTCVNEPRMIKLGTDLDILEMAFGDSADARKEWMMR